MVLAVHDGMLAYNIPEECAAHVTYAMRFKRHVFIDKFHSKIRSDNLVLPRRVLPT